MFFTFSSHDSSPLGIGGYIAMNKGIREDKIAAGHVLIDTRNDFECCFSAKGLKQLAVENRENNQQINRLILRMMEVD
jgi:hypothetical protein